MNRTPYTLGRFWRRITSLYRAQLCHGDHELKPPMASRDDEIKPSESEEIMPTNMKPTMASHANHLKPTVASQPDHIKSTTDDANSQKLVPFFKLFCHADGLDVVMMILGSIGAIIHGIAMPVYFNLLSKFLNIFGGHTSNSVRTVSQYSLNLLFLGLIVWAAAWTEVFCWTYTGERQAFQIRSKYLQALLRRDIKQFDVGLQTGEMIESLTSDTLLIQNAIGEKMGNALHYLATFLAGLIIGFATVWQMALVTIGTVPLIAAAVGLQAFLITNISSKSQEAYGKAGVIAEQAIAQVRTVYAFVGETKAMEAYSTALVDALKLGYKSGFVNGVGIGTSFIAIYGSFSLLVWFGSVLVLHGSARGASALITILLIILGGTALGQASLSFSAFAQAQGAAQKIFPVIENTANIEKKNSSGKQIRSLQGKIEFQEVEFSYPSRPDVPILHKFSLTVPQGKNVAIVGSSGSGKSTIIALVERFYDPVTGHILLDGHDIKSLQLKWLRLQLALVSQEPALFATTIRENIILGKENATVEEIEEAARFSNAHTFIQKFPDGYNTKVGERGVQLSGGQKQRIAIARAVIKNPSVLLLDEATSALDSSSEKLVQDALDRFMITRTTIVIAHRLSTIQHVDTIVVVEKGNVVEIGTHEELMLKEENGAYHKLVKLQEMGLGTIKAHRHTSSVQWNSGRSTPRCTPGSTPIRIHSSPHISPLMGGLPFNTEISQSMSAIFEPVPMDGDTTVVATDTAYIQKLLNLNAPEWPHAILGSVGCVLTGIVNPFTAFLLASVASLYYHPNHHYVRVQGRLYAAYFAILALVGLIGYIIQEYSWGYVNENLTKRVREKMLSAILRNEISWFDKEENNSSQLSARLASDATTIRTVLGTRISLLLSNLTVLAVACIISFILSWKMSLVTLSVFPLAVLAAVAEKAFLKGYTGDVELAHFKATKLAGEAVANVRTVAAFCAEEKIISLFEGELESTKRQSQLRGQVSGFTFGIAKFVQFSSYALALWYGLRLVRHEGTDPGHVVRVFFVLLVAAIMVGDAIGIVPDLVKGGSALKSVFAVLDRETQIDPDDENAANLDVVKGEIELKKVDFSYPARLDVPIFKNFSLRVPAGTSLALVGPSGCGKSTVVSLIERFYDPVRGSVMIDGVDIRNYNLKSLRWHVGLVQQEPALFATTIYDNILYGNVEATLAEVEVAARAANAHDFISGLPEGYKTFVGESGAQLSGGQKQRVAIARAILRNPAVLLLDEATSALDTEAEKLVQEAIEKLMDGRTVVVIAHRLSTIHNVDSIAVLQDGAVVEQGCHSELLSKPYGAYSRLVALQNQRTASS